MSWSRHGSGGVYRRCDGAEVRPAQDPSASGMRGWTASGPSSSMRRRVRVDRAESRTPLRRFGTAASAMAAVDAEFPLQGGLSL